MMVKNNSDKLKKYNRAEDCHEIFNDTGLEYEKLRTYCEIKRQKIFLETTLNFSEKNTKN